MILEEKSKEQIRKVAWLWLSGKVPELDLSNPVEGYSSDALTLSRAMQTVTVSRAVHKILRARCLSYARAGCRIDVCELSAARDWLLSIASFIPSRPPSRVKPSAWHKPPSRGDDVPMECLPLVDKPRSRPPSRAPSLGSL